MSSTLEQPKEVTDYLRNLLTDPYNKYCIDCHTRESTHASIRTGTFICETCANVLKVTFGMSVAYIKSVFGEQWDDYQLAAVSHEFGGN